MSRTLMATFFVALGFSQDETTGEPPVPCSDNISEEVCADWAARGECDTTPELMLELCPATCNWCPGEERQVKCVWWAKYGMCNTRPEFMFTHCVEECIAEMNAPEDDPEECFDNVEGCPDAAHQGECMNRWGFMRTHCPESCAYCPIMQMRLAATCHDDGNTPCRELANQGMCDINPTYMGDLCPFSCRVCTHKKEHCRDKNTVACKHYGIHNQCSATPESQAYMELNCPVTCGHCLPILCKDEDPVNCQYWAQKGHCMSNPAFMKTVCSRSCKFCANGSTENTCRDWDSSCPARVEAGECHSNAKYMQINCRRSCGYCSDCTNIYDTAVCERMAFEGGCESNAMEMGVKCKKACNMCEGHCYDLLPECPAWAEVEACETKDPFYDKYCRKSCGICETERTCQDKHAQCHDWAASGACYGPNKDFMHHQCEVSCKACARSATDCFDRLETCHLLKSEDDGCQTNVEFMSAECSKTCGFCDDMSDAMIDLFEIEIKGPRDPLLDPMGDNDHCVDDYEECKLWAQGGDCFRTPEFMKIHCKKSCHKCKQDCNDVYLEECKSWAKEGQCMKNEKFMTKNCPKTCGTCSPHDCVDVKEECEKWSAEGMCKTHIEFMSTSCRKSCNMCPDRHCFDEHEMCGDFAGKGYCDTMRQWMSANCRRSCMLCADPWHLSFRPFFHHESEAHTCPAKLTAGQECIHSFLNCADGLFCDKTEMKCAAAPKENEVCTFTATQSMACGKDLYCRHATVGDSCTKRPSLVTGRKCKRAKDCTKKGYYCNMEAKKCTKKPVAGQKCIPDGDETHSCAEGFVCGRWQEPFTCEALPTAGHRCALDHRWKCAEGFFCDFAKGEIHECQARPPMQYSGKCNRGKCNAGMFCDPDSSQCATLPEKGQKCTPEGTCAEGHHCTKTQFPFTCWEIVDPTAHAPQPGQTLKRVKRRKQNPNGLDAGVISSLRTVTSANLR